VQQNNLNIEKITIISMMAYDSVTHAGKLDRGEHGIVGIERRVGNCQEI
jgi:hypothetical protein